MRHKIFLSAFLLFTNLVYASAETVPVWSTNQKVVIVVLENTDYQDAVKQPFLSRLASQGVLFTNFHAIGHPSQPNYIAMVAGDKLGVSGDGHYDLNATNIADLLEAKGLSWKVYAEQFPGKCNLVDKKSKYVRKHNPLISFKNIQKNPARCANIVDSASFNSDFKNGHLANYNMYIPNLVNDGHDTTPAYADQFMLKTFGALINDAQMMKDVLFIVLFDEDEHILAGDNQIYAVMYGPGIKMGTQISTKYDHYSLLRTIEDGFQLDSLGRKDAKALPLVGFWQ